MSKPSTFRNIAIGIVNVAVFYFLIAWVLDNIRPGLLIEQLRALPWAPVASIVFFTLIVFVFSGLRLAILIARPFGVAFKIVNLGAAFNTILPLRLGEAARIYYAKRMFGVSATKLFANGLVEKFFDLISLAGLAVAATLFGNNAFVSPWLVLVLFSVVLGAYVALQLFRRYFHFLGHRLAGMEKILALLASLREHGRVHHLWPVAGCTFAIWLANLLVVFFGFSGFLPTQDLGIFDAVSLLVMTALAVAIPSAPAGLGVFEAGVVAYLTQVLQVENELALAAAIVFHLAMVIPQLVFSLLIALRPGVRLFSAFKQ